MKSTFPGSYYVAPWVTHTGTASTVPHIADRYLDLLDCLPAPQRTHMVAQLTSGFSEGWRPTRRELADTIAAEVGLLSVQQLRIRRRQRQLGAEPESLIPALQSWHRERARRRIHHRPGL